MQQVKKVVLAYSGGVDTSVCIPYLKNEYGISEVVTFVADLGQGEDLELVRQKALNSGASKSIVGNLVNSFVEKKKDRQLIMNYFNVKSMSDDVSRFISLSVDFAKIPWGSFENEDGKTGIDNNNQNLAKFRYLQFKNNLINDSNNDSQTLKVEVLPDVNWSNNKTLEEIYLKPRLVSPEIDSKFITINSYKAGITSNNLIVISEADYCQVMNKYSFLALMKLSAPLIVQVETNNRSLVKSMFIGKILRIRGVFENGRDSHVKFKIFDSV